MNDPIADMLTRIRNAVAAGRTHVLIPHSKMKESIAQILRDGQFIRSFRVNTSGQFKSLELELPAAGSLNHVQRLSKPGRRLYVSRDDIPMVLGGRGLVVVSTSRGLMTGGEARKQNLGGELICKVW